MVPSTSARIRKGSCHRHMLSTSTATSVLAKSKKLYERLSRRSVQAGIATSHGQMSDEELHPIADLVNMNMSEVARDRVKASAMRIANSHVANDKLAGCASTAAAMSAAVAANGTNASALSTW